MEMWGNNPVPEGAEVLGVLRLADGREGVLFQMRTGCWFGVNGELTRIGRSPAQLLASGLSESKRRAIAENGKKGGRPKKVVD